MFGFFKKKEKQTVEPEKVQKILSPDEWREAVVLLRTKKKISASIDWFAELAEKWDCQICYEDNGYGDTTHDLVTWSEEYKHGIRHRLEFNEDADFLNASGGICLRIGWDQTDAGNLIDDCYFGWYFCIEYWPDQDKDWKEIEFDGDGQIAGAKRACQKFVNTIKKAGDAIGETDLKPSGLKLS